MRDCIQSNPAGESTNAESPKTIRQEVMDLKVAVKGILDSLSKIGPVGSPNASKVLHSTPISSHTLFNGTNGSDTNENNDGTANDEYFLLYLSNIDPSVTERDVHRMVSCTLGTPECERVDVVKLSRNWSDRRMLDFISFKVVIAGKFKKQAISA